MRKDRDELLPAAYPALGFALGLATADVITAPFIAAAGLAAIALLSAFLTGRTTSIPLLFAAAGFYSAASWQDARAVERAWLDSLPADRFVVAIVPVEGAWEARGEGFTLRSRSFRVEGRGDRIELPLRLTLWAGHPLDDPRIFSLRAEGHLRCGEEICSMNVKSAELLSAHSFSNRADPGWWNRAANHRLLSLTSSSPMAARGAPQAAALALGRGEALQYEVREAYRRGGTYHLLVFSGMQIAFAAGMISAVFRRLGRPRYGDWILLGMALLAPQFAGKDASVTRSALMIGVYALSRILGRPTPLANLLFVAILARLITSPADLTDPGFALTFGATGGLILIGRAFSELVPRFLRPVAWGAGAEIGTASLTALFFHQVVIAGSLVTLAISPLLTLMLALSAIASMLVFVSRDLAMPLVELIGTLDTVAVGVNQFVADLGAATVVAAPHPLLVGLAFAIAVAVLTLRRSPAVGLAASIILLVPLLAGLVAAASRSSVEAVTFEFLDVGQGDAILVREGKTALLVDGGGRPHDPDFARSVLLPLLLDRGVRKLDAVVLSHPDPDHCGGLPPLVDLLDVREVWMSSRHLRFPCGGDLFDAARRKGSDLVLADRQAGRAAGSLFFRFHAADPPFKQSFSNNTSLLLRWSRGRRSVLLMGDIERAAEFKLLENDPSFASAEVLKVAHHGSSSSTSFPFLAVSEPRIAIISAGRRNPYSHPSPEVEKRVREAGARILRTDRNGSIRLHITERAVFVSVEIDKAAPAGSL